MKHLLELKEELDILDDIQLMKQFNEKPIHINKLNYYPVFAKRMPLFKDFLFQELISEKNINIEFRTFKPSWYIAISILDYCENEVLIKQMVTHIHQNWNKGDYESFVNYIGKEDRFKKFFF